MVGTFDQFLEVLGGVLLSLIGYLLNRELTQLDENHKELAGYLRELADELHGIDSRLCVAESQLEERERRR